MSGIKEIHNAHDLIRFTCGYLIIARKFCLSNRTSPMGCKL